ncbi:ALBINO3-like protein 2, chloroplastic [Ricinus communis]|uniref:Cytochrome oxidase biogenesis protein, putative n=1 Tax=Ricinus communis TaxID=3988 RepID=B9RFU8_RICCO|nr:ALBINO3-like protein 2, chloroplastic [Ricinus communis]EEF50069.1 cytochrome oxidase biogenesis protein, putative [Ricinus communis]|eukprot:XP_002512617.1 ALBINO3-like protein 2, chloroplastic [Ricinus communis]
MAVPRLLFSHIRRSRPLCSLSYWRLSNPNLNCSQSPTPSHKFANSLAAFHFLDSRSFSSPSNHDGSDFLANSAAEPSSIVSDVIETVGNITTNGGNEESILPVRVLVSVLDEFHDLSGLPWWLVIASATVAMRVTLFPLLVLQLHKLKKISELFPKLPPPFPPPLSGKSFVDQISLFHKERRALGCPSYLWFLAYVSAQVPCFLLWMTSIRRMSLDHHPGFDCGGTLWFQNLTEYPHGIAGPIFPLLIACLHYINIQLAFEKFSVQKTTGLLSLLAKYYKLYLDLLTLPLFFIGYCIPQGSLVYWVTNSSLSVIQQMSLKHPAVRAKLGLPAKDAPAASADSEEMGSPQASLDAPSKNGKVPVENLNPKQLLAISVQLLSNQHRERAIPLLQLALQKDPNYIGALVVMGQTLLQKEMYAEARDHLERAISKLFLAGNPTEVKDVDLLILASQWAGVACIRQGENAEGVAHFERVANLEEPEDPKCKVHYFDTLIFLASALYNEGRKAEAANYLRLAVAFNPAFKELLEQCENDEEFGSDLVNSRRRDY